ncbi:hypothetical protein HAV15_006715 [Penicillium sp. str. |nr:hypothetical protein HAV15_006715 [Penicillium sp. str. \
MLRDSRYSPTHSSGSSGGNGYVVSVNICGRGDVHQGDPPAHWEVMLRKRGETDGDLYRVRKNENFYYEDPVQTRAVESATSYGRNEIQHLSDSSKETAARVLNTDYWSQNIGQASSEVGARLRREGGSWVPSPPVYYKGRGPADATSGKEQVRQPVNRYNLDEFAGLSSSSKSRR